MNGGGEGRCQRGFASSLRNREPAGAGVEAGGDGWSTGWRWLRRPALGDESTVPAQDGGDVEPGAVAEIVARLRAESKVIICGSSGWTIASAE
jgi:hypothetical protein